MHKAFSIIQIKDNNFELLYASFVLRRLICYKTVLERLWGTAGKKNKSVVTSNPYSYIQNTGSPQTLKTFYAYLENIFELLILALLLKRIK